MAVDERRPRVIDFYEEVVQPALMARLDQAFPEFGWRRDARGWVATNQEHTHVRLYRRLPEHLWELRVHEQILSSLVRNGARILPTTIPIAHVGYRDPAQSGTRWLGGRCGLLF